MKYFISVLVLFFVFSINVCAGEVWVACDPQVDTLGYKVSLNSAPEVDVPYNEQNGNVHLLNITNIPDGTHTIEVKAYDEFWESELVQWSFTKASPSGCSGMRLIRKD